MKQILVEPIILLFAFRYALGRMTYAPAVVIGSIIENVEGFRTEHLKNMVNEIYETDSLGSDYDKYKWESFAEILEKEIEGRKTK